MISEKIIINLIVNNIMPRNIVRLSASEQGENEITIFTDTSKKCEVHTFNYREEGPKLNFLNALFDYIEKNYPNHS